MIKFYKKWSAIFKKLVLIAENHDGDWTQLINRVERSERVIRQCESLIRERTEVAADIHPSRIGESFVIVVGRYRNNDYVQTYSLGREGQVDHIIHTLRSMERTAEVRRIDAPPIFKQVFERERR